MRIHARYPDWHEGDVRPLSLDCYRAAPGSTVRRVLDLTGATARVTVRRYGGLTHGEVVIDRGTAEVSDDATNRFDYWPTSDERRLLTVGSYQVTWRVVRAGRTLQHGPIDLSVLEGDGDSDSIGEPMALVFNVNSNSGLLAAI
jgi:hypothetical protein